MPNSNLQFTWFTRFATAHGFGFPILSSISQFSVLPSIIWFMFSMSIQDSTLTVVIQHCEVNKSSTSMTAISTFQSEPFVSTNLPKSNGFCLPPVPSHPGYSHKAHPPAFKDYIKSSCMVKDIQKTVFQWSISSYRCSKTTTGHYVKFSAWCFYHLSNKIYPHVC